jgi:GT2 family glycosyltransferase
MNCDIVIPVFNRLEMTKDCLESIIRETTSPYRFIIIDNGSAPETKSYLESFIKTNNNSILIRNPENLGWVKAVNQGLKAAAASYVCIMNNDTVVRTGDWLTKLIKILQDGRNIGMISPIFDIKEQDMRKDPFIETDYCRGHCIVIGKDLADKIGPLDETFGMGYYDDVDYSLRASGAGYICAMANGVLVEHVRNSTFSSVLNGHKIAELQEKNRKYLESKWGRRLRLVFITDGSADLPKMSDLLFAVARRRHYIYIWNTGGHLNLLHTNMTERRFPRIFSAALFQMMLTINRLKKPNKRYDGVFYLKRGFSSGDIKAGIERLSKV